MPIRTITALLLFLTASALYSNTLLAAGPVDAEVGALWWAHDVDDSDLADTDADGGGAYAELWLANAWGVAGKYFESDPDRGGFGSASSLSIDVKRRFVSPTENNFVALGGGWHDADLVTGGNASGPRFLVEGRLGVGILFVYGQAAYMPDLGDAGLRRDIEATETEFGVSFTPFPFLNLRAGYRQLAMDFRGGSQESDGYYLGGAIHF